MSYDVRDEPEQAVESQLHACQDLFNKNVVGEDVYYTTLEALNDNKELVMKEICEYLGLEYESRMLEEDRYNFHYPEYIKATK